MNVNNIRTIFKDMKYIITESQYRLINEALGVPSSIVEAGEEMYYIIADDLKSITEKEEEYEFSGEVDFTIGEKQKIIIDGYELKVIVIEDDDYDGVAIAQMGMRQTFGFDRSIKMKRIKPSSNAEFTITFVANPSWVPKDLYEEFISKKDEYIGSITHELKHKYDKQVNQISLIGKDAEYSGPQNAPRFGIPSIDDEFYHYLYYTNAAESVVRPSEVATNIKTQNITKSQFKDFLLKNKTFNTLQKIKDFTFESFIKGIYDNMDRVDFILNKVNEDPESMTDKEKVERILDLIYVNLVNSKMEKFDEYVDGPDSDPLFKLFSQMFGDRLPGFEDVSDVREKFVKYILRYKNKPVRYFQDEIKKFNKIADKLMKKIAKLYDIAKDDNEGVTESIINWELWKLIQEKKYGPTKIEKEFKYKKF